MYDRMKMIVLAIMSMGCGAALMHAANANAQRPATGVGTSELAAMSPPPPIEGQLVRKNANSTNNAVQIKKLSTGAIEVDFGSFTTNVPTSQAGTTLRCSKTESYHLDTGTNGGKCTVNHENGTANCTDGTNTSNAACTTGCGSTSGAGDCT